MNASRTGSSETVYFELTDLHLHIRTTIRNESPAIKLICVRFSALKGFIVSGRVPDLMERPKMKSDVVPGQNWKGGDFPAVSALASTQTFAKCTGNFGCDKMTSQSSALFMTCSIQNSFSGKL